MPLQQLSIIFFFPLKTMTVVDLYDLFTEDELNQVNELFLVAFIRKFNSIPEVHELITKIEYDGVLD